MPRYCTDEHVISPALKRRLTDKSAYHKQSEQRVLTLWSLLSSDGNCVSDMKYETDNDEEIENNNYVKQNEQCVSTTHATVMNDLDGPLIDPIVR